MSSHATGSRLIATMGLMVVALGLTGCPARPVLTKVFVANYLPRTVQVKVTALDTDQNIVASPSVIVGPARPAVIGPDGGVLVESVPGIRDGGLEFEVAKKGRIRYEYTPVGTSSSMPLPEDSVPNDSSRPYIIEKLIPETPSFDSAGSYRQLEQLAEELGAQGQPVVGRLVDFIPRLSAAIVVDAKGELKDLVQLSSPPEIKFSPPFTVLRTVLLDKSLATKIKVAVPVYGSIDTSITDSSLYKATVEIKHTPFENPFELASSLLNAEDVKLQAIQGAMAQHADCAVRVIRGFRYVESAVFAVEQGIKFNGSTNLAVASVLTADAVYTFSKSQQSINTLAQAVFNFRYSEWKCAAVNALIDAKLKKKPLTAPKATIDSSIRVVAPPSAFSEKLAGFKLR